VSKASTAISGSEAAADAARDWQAVRGSSDIQYSQFVPPKKAPPPEWLTQFGDWLQSVFGPLGRGLGLSWPVMQWILVALLVIAVALIAWRILAPLITDRRAQPAPAEDWSPDRGAALALLEDADRLAACGQFDAAAHLLLQRSVHQIASARPDWLHPASTAREIAALGQLPASARHAFAVIATRVERSRYALRALEAADWHAAREAYAAFALERLELSA